MRGRRAAVAGIVATFLFASAGHAASAAHTKAIRDLAVDAAGRYLVTASDDRTVRVWDATTGKPLQTLAPPVPKAATRPFLAVAISPDSATIACGGDDGATQGADETKIYVYQRATGKLLHTLPVGFVVDGLAYARDGAFLVATGSGTGLPAAHAGADAVFATPDYRRDRGPYLPNAGAASSFADFDARGRLLLLQKFGVWSAELMGHDAHESREVRFVPVAVKISPDGGRIAFAIADGSVAVYSGDDLSLLYRPDVTGIGPAEIQYTDEMGLTPTDLATIAWSADGTALYYAGGRTCVRDACFVRRWSDSGRGAFEDVVVTRSQVTRLATLPDGRIGYASLDPALGVLDAQGRRTSFFGAREPPPTSLPARKASATPSPAASPLSEAAVTQLRELHGQVTSLMARRRYRDAESPAKRAVDVVRQPDNEESVDPALTGPLLDLARVRRALGGYRQAAGESALTSDDYHDAVALYGRVADALEAAGGNPRERAVVLAELGELHAATNDQDRAADALQESVVLREQALGDTDPLTVETGVELATVRTLKYIAEERFVDAFTAAQSALSRAESDLPPDRPALALAVANLAAVHRAFRARDLRTAAALYGRVLRIRKRALGSRHWDVVNSLRQLAEVDVDRKRPAAATRLYARALRIEERALGPDDPALARLTTTVARMYQDRGDFVSAERLYRRVLAIREREDIDPYVAHALIDLGDMYRAMRRPLDAEPLYTRALALQEQSMGLKHFNVAETARDLGTAYRIGGPLAEARPLYDRAVAIHRDGGDIALPWALRDRAALAVAEDDPRAALDLLSESLAAQEPTLAMMFHFDREEGQLEAQQSRYVSGGYDFLLWLVAHRFGADPAVARDAFQLVLRRKGMVLDIQARAARNVTRRSPDAREKLDQLAAIRAELSGLLLHRPQAMSDDEYRTRVSLLFEKASTLENATRPGDDDDADPLNRTVTVAAVAARLPPETALIEVVEIPEFDYAREDFDFPRAEWSSASRFLAFVLNGSGQVTLVDLVDGGELKAAVDTALRDVRGTGARWRDDLRALYGRVWRPLVPVLGDADRIVVAPDGVLNLVPFAALIDPDGKFLVERYEISYATSGRELLDGPQGKPSTELFLAAAPSFGSRQLAAAEAYEEAFRSRDVQSDFADLPGAAREATDIPPLVPAGGERTVLVGAAATETAVKAARRPRIMHLATHGFFLPDQTLGMDDPQYETPLIRSGLAFAGANFATLATTGDDGLLTALEIAGMDLSATELVVLSACDTGVGEVRTGEGVFGLRRAFTIAGAANLLMSLWRVDDVTTADQMRRFYANLPKMAPAGALREAQLANIAQLRTRDGDAQPRLWAPFVVQGPGRRDSGDPAPRMSADRMTPSRD